MTDINDSNVSNPELPSDALLSMRSECSKGEKKSKGSGTSFEVFRNNTTAVEVIVKEVPQKPRKKLSADDLNLNVQNLKIRGLEETNEFLINELNKSNGNLVITTNRFKAIFAEMRKQIDAAYSHETEAQERCLNLQFENEKLKALLQSKTSLVVKLKKELNNLKKVIKFVVKSMSFVPEVSQVSFNSDAEYDVFEKDLNKDGNVKFLSNFYDGSLTFNSTNLSKDIKGSVETRL